MKQVVIICGENKLRCSQIIDSLCKENKERERIKLVSTNVDDGLGCEVVSRADFWGMVEQGCFLEVMASYNGYVGTPHIKKEIINDQFMVNDISVALSIKKMQPKAITIYVLPQEKQTKFKTSSNYQEVTKLDFLIVDNDLLSTVKKIEEIVNFMNENGMK